MDLLPRLRPQAQVDETYWERVRQRAAELGSDGCTLVTELYQDCCLEHDIAYRTGRDLDGHPITRAQADQRFRQCIQARSPLGRFSPLAWWRWAGVRLFGWLFWKGGRPWNT